MHICECENPKYIFNPYLGEDVRTGCGKCPSCLNQKASSWVSRLIQEGRAHKYSFMVNLTYEDSHLPKLFFDDTFENVVSDDRSLCIPLHELTSLCTTQKELDYLSNRLRHPLGLPFCFSEDISKFLKRLNKYIHDKITNESTDYIRLATKITEGQSNDILQTCENNLNNFFLTHNL